jgi:hypothetical protein
MFEYYTELQNCRNTKAWYSYVKIKTLEVYVFYLKITNPAGGTVNKTTFRPE